MSDSSGLPSTPPGEPEATVPTVPHDHPIPRSRQWGERVVIGGLLLFGLLTTAMPFLVAAQIRAEVAEEFEQQDRERQAEDDMRAERTRLAVCTVIGESFEPTEAIAQLSRELGCPVDATGQPVPQPVAPPNPTDPRSNNSAAGVDREPADEQGRPVEQERSPSPSPRPQPPPPESSPSPTPEPLLCQLGPLPVVCPARDS